jgi:broad specificity phosphatase PhoE
MEIILYRHAEPVVSNNEIIFGYDFPSWVQRYNASGIIAKDLSIEKEKLIYTSDLLRSIETGKLIGEKVIQDSLFREAEISLIKFPAIRLKAQYWLVISRCLWLLGFRKKCEPFHEARQRAKQIVDKIESLLLEHQRIVIIGHGFINRLIRTELLHRNWMLKESSDRYEFLGKMVFATVR